MSTKWDIKRTFAHPDSINAKVKSEINYLPT